MNITNGLPSRPEKIFGMEIPMWLVNSHNQLAADRSLRYSMGSVDDLWNRYLPSFQHFIRKNVLGKEAADAALEADSILGLGKHEQALAYQRMAEI